MSTVSSGHPETVADLLARLDFVPAERIRLHPAPGTATEGDALRTAERDEPTCELFDGTLVEKPVGVYESVVAATLVGILRSFVAEHDLGVVITTDAPVRVAPEQIRVPDAGFFSWETLGGVKEPISPVTPDLAVEVLSPGNTAAEMSRKQGEYFASGARLVWLVDPSKRTVEVAEAPDASTTVGEADRLDGGTLLPGFDVLVGDLFRDADRLQSGRP